MVCGGEWLGSRYPLHTVRWAAVHPRLGGAIYPAFAVGDIEAGSVSFLSWGLKPQGTSATEIQGSFGWKAGVPIRRQGAKRSRKADLFRRDCPRSSRANL